MAVVAFSCSSTKTNFKVRSMATEYVQLALCGAHLGNVDVEVADRVALELPLPGPVAVNKRKRQMVDDML
jgi:hypothetical protein